VENNKYKTENIHFMQHACCDESNLYAGTRIRRTSLLSVGASEKKYHKKVRLSKAAILNFLCGAGKFSNLVCIWPT
jgi:hypothetical protein